MTAFQGIIQPIRLTCSVQQALGEHLLSCYPREACGVLLGAAAAGGMQIHTYVPIRNVAPNPLHTFIPDPEDWVKALYLEPAPIGLFHSHPQSAPIPSITDLRGLRALGPEFLVYLIGSLGRNPDIPLIKGYHIDRQRDPNGKLSIHLQEVPLHALLK
ncbi:MAG: M67 family metallopeptidase [Paenibacillus sp.]|nr:M67 family metallopeptidase [Paenibacillus sp.]